jgi:hypothetical protein
MATRNITPPTTPPAIAPVLLLFFKLPELARSVAWLALRVAVACGACGAVVEMSFPWGMGILIGEAEKLESEAVVSVVDDGGAADVVGNATSVDADCGWADDARA